MVSVGIPQTSDERRKLEDITRILNSHPEYRTTESMSTLMQAAYAKLMLESGHVPVPPPQISTAVSNARVYLDDYSEYVHGYTPTPFHLQWMRALMSPNIKRLLIIAPPDHAKTQIVAVQYPCFLIGQNPNIHIGFISNTSTQAERRSIAVRDTIALNEKYKTVFPQVIPDRKGWSAAEWYVHRNDPGDKDSTYKASGAFGPITGDRYDILIMDDIVDLENIATAYQRDKLREWVEITALTRVVPGGKVVAIMTRYHHEDIANYFMQLGWHVIHMPALRDAVDINGNPTVVALWEDRWSAEALLRKRAESPLMFERVYQGHPTPQEGALVQESWWQYYDALPAVEPVRTIQVMDTASKIKTINDFSVIATWALYPDGDVYLIDLVHDKMLYPQLKQAAKLAYTRNEPDLVIIESASSGIALYQELRQTTSMPLREVNADRDKAARLNAVIDYIATGRCHIPRFASWVGEFVREHSEFPMGAHDDIVDTTSLALSELYLRGRSTKFLSLGTEGGFDAARTRVRDREQTRLAMVAD